MFAQRGEFMVCAVHYKPCQPNSQLSVKESSTVVVLPLVHID